MSDFFLLIPISQLPHPSHIKNETAFHFNNRSGHIRINISINSFFCTINKTLYLKIPSKNHIRFHILTKFKSNKLASEKFRPPPYNLYPIN